MKRIVSIFILTLFLASCSSINLIEHDYSSNTFDITHVKSNLEFLASDYLQGRDAASLSEKVASQFIAGELQKYGLQPFGDDGTYFQNITFNSRKISGNSKIVIYNSDSSITALELGKDFATQAYRLFNPDFMDKRLPIVFAGYGIMADEYGYDDYSYIDPAGKIVIIMPGEPHSENEEFFKGEERTKYSSSFRKSETAKEKGAAGILIIPSDEYLAYWDMLAERSTKESLQLDNGGDETAIPAAMISHNTAAELLDGEEQSFEDILNTINNKDIPQAFELSKYAEINFEIIEEERSGRNVVALLPGTNPELDNEYITIGAHYDHVGVSGGEVYNGADDNGSGTVTVLESARTLSGERGNERPVLFILYTAEEKGLLGSKYFVNNCDYLDNIIANINIDMTGRGSIDSIHCIGSDRVSVEFDNIIKDANSESVNYCLDYSLSHTRLFRQSDHYSFAEQEIPVVFFFDNMRQDLHRPGDDVEKINFSKICKTAHLTSRIALKVANLDHTLYTDKE